MQSDTYTPNALQQRKIIELANRQCFPVQCLLLFFLGIKDKDFDLLGDSFHLTFMGGIPALGSFNLGGIEINTVPN